MTPTTRSTSQLNKVSIRESNGSDPHVEIYEYAEFLGMDLNEDQDLLYIAEEGVSGAHI